AADAGPGDRHAGQVPLAVGLRGAAGHPLAAGLLSGDTATGILAGTPPPASWAGDTRAGPLSAGPGSGAGAARTARPRRGPGRSGLRDPAAGRETGHRCPGRGKTVPRTAGISAPGTTAAGAEDFRPGPGIPGDFSRESRFPGEFPCIGDFIPPVPYRTQETDNCRITEIAGILIP